MAKSSKPTGLTIKRSGNSFTFSWKCGDKDYKDGQRLEYKLAGGKWTSVSIGASTRAKTVSFAANKFYPSAGTKETLKFRVRGNRDTYTSGSGKNKKTYNPGWSDWAEKTFTFKKPAVPSLTAALSDTLWNSTTFTWNTTTSTTDRKHFVNVELQSILVKNCDVTDGSKLTWNSNQLGWASGAYSANNSRTFTEDTSLITGGSYTRWVRVRSRGARGASAWRYAKHVYALPYQTQDVTAFAQETAEGGYNCVVNWSISTPASHPVDKITPEYLITTPEAGLTCPDDATWTEVAGQISTDGTDSTRFSIDQQLGTDKCLFVRVNTEHDKMSNRGVTYGAPVLAAVGYLANPTITSVQTDSQTHRATITASNASSVEDSFLEITYMQDNEPENAFVVGIIPHGGTSVTVQCPDWAGSSGVAFGVRAVVGSYAPVERADGADSYNVIARMVSADTVWEGGDVPLAPDNVTVSQTSVPGTVRVTWDWTWNGANSAEISWADHEDAWESTDEPQTYTISNLHAAKWNIANLETGVTWYIRVRLLAGSGDDATAGPWSDPVTIDLSSAPNIPVLYLSAGTITADGDVTASWGFSTTDGTGQAYAEICEATYTSQGIEYGDPIASTETAQHITLNAEEQGWTAGNTYNLCVRVVSASGRASDNWSDPVSVTVAEPLECTITQTSLETVTIIIDTEEETEAQVTALTEMPLTVTATGAGAGGTTTIAIERAESYFMDRPDETDFNGYAGETVALHTQQGEGQVTFNVADLIGRLDDGAPYRIVATVQDGLGQSAQASVDFWVYWSHQAIIPEATCEIDTTNLIAKITPVAPEGALETDICDIYRLSADRPELIVQGGSFGTTYVDPYPALGEHGGHRVVMRTANGDYITEDLLPAWIDLREEEGDILQTQDSYIDFDGERIPISYNTELSSSFEKGFKETQYLGGSVQGDWNLAYSRSSTIKAVVTTPNDGETIEALRRLAIYPGIVHVRTKDGSSYAADVQVSDDLSYQTAGKIFNYDLKITRVDPEGFEGVALAEYEGTQE